MSLSLSLSARAATLQDFGPNEMFIVAHIFINVKAAPFQTTFKRLSYLSN